MNKIFKGFFLFSIIFFIVVPLLSFSGILAFGYGLGDITYEIPIIIGATALIAIFIIFRNIDFDKQIVAAIIGIFILSFFIIITIRLFTFGRGPEFKWDGHIFLASTKHDRVKQEFDSEMKMLNDSINKNPNNYSAYFEKGFQLRAQGKFNESINEYKNALKINPNFFDANFQCAWSYESLKDTINAIFYFEKALTIDTGNKYVKEYLGNLKRQNGNLHN
ncbi:MAG TPA: tetratricopeptide repeat protein [Bacteroidia bacterium]|jgi:hypothetical protein|nr:tetratricopeptide repeat protein [Bacteroidia bacterium]